MRERGGGKREREGVLKREEGRNGSLNAALCFVQCFDPLSTFPRAGRHSQEVSRQKEGQM